MSISGKTWCEIWHSSHNKIVTLLSQCPSSGYFKNQWSLDLFLKNHRENQIVYFFYLGLITPSNIQDFYRASYFITRGNRIWVDFNEDVYFTSEDKFWMIFCIRDDVIGNVFPEVGVPLRQWYRDLYQGMKLVGSLVSGLLTRFYLLFLSSGRNKL